MKDRTLRERIAVEAARLMYAGEETELLRAKRKAARLLGFRFTSKDIPSNREVQDRLDRLAMLTHSPWGNATPRSLRVEALRWMRRLGRYSPKLVGRLAEPNPPGDCRVEIHVWSASLKPVRDLLDHAGNHYVIGRGRWPSGVTGPEMVPLDIAGDLPIELRVHLAPSYAVRYDGLSVAELEELLRETAPETDLEAELEGLDTLADRFAQFVSLLEPLEQVKQDPLIHPEGDCLFHSLQVFDLAAQERPYDEEFLSAALLHDVGKAIDPRNHWEATLSQLEGLVTHRTRWFIHGLSLVKKREYSRLTPAEKRLIEQSEDREELELFAELDRRGRKRGATTRSIEQAIDYLRGLEAECRWDDTTDEVEAVF